MKNITVAGALDETGFREKVQEKLGASLVDRRDDCDFIRGLRGMGGGLRLQRAQLSFFFALRPGE